MVGFVNRDFGLLQRLLTEVGFQWEQWRSEAGFHATPGECGAMMHRLMLTHPNARETGLQRGMSPEEALAVIDDVFARQSAVDAADRRRRLIMSEAAAPSQN